MIKQLAKKVQAPDEVNILQEEEAKAKSTIATILHLAMTEMSTELKWRLVSLLKIQLH